MSSLYPFFKQRCKGTPNFRLCEDFSKGIHDNHRKKTPRLLIYPVGDTEARITDIIPREIKKEVSLFPIIIFAETSERMGSADFFMFLTP